MNSTRKLWAIWCLLVFGLFNLYGPSLWSYRTPDDPADISMTGIASRLTLLQSLGIIVRNDTDTARYFAYANAMLGRPYSTLYVRKMEAWTKASSGDEDNHAGAYPIVRPERALWPWRDFSMEYPPGMAVFAILPALLTRDFDTYHLLFGLEMELLLTMSVFCAVRAMDRLAPGQGARTLGFSIALTAALGFIAARRYDACISASLGLTFLALAARRPAGAGAALALGVVAKGAPILFAPLGAIYYASARRWRELYVSLGAAGAVCLFVCLAYLVLAGDHWRDFFTYHGARPLQIESTYAALLILLSALDPSLVAGSANAYGSTNIVSAYEPLLRPIGELAPLLATLAICWWFWRSRRDGDSEFDRLAALAKGVCAIIVAFSTLGKVFSPQYLVWLTPVAAIASLKSTRATKISLFVGLGLTQFDYPYCYIFLASSLPPIFGLLALVRNLALIFWAAQLLFAKPETEFSPKTPPLAAQTV